MVYLRTKYEILNVLYQMGAKSKLVAATQKMIKEGLLEVDIDYTDKTIYKHLRELLDLGYVKYGMNQLNAKTYYITAKGVEWVKAMEAEEVEPNLWEVMDSVVKKAYSEEQDLSNMLNAERAANREAKRIIADLRERLAKYETDAEA